MHLADKADFRAEHVGERLAVGEHVFRFVAGFAAEVEVREIAFAGAAESRGVDDFDAGGQHDRNGHGNRVAVFVSGVDGVGIEDRVIVLCAAHVLFSLVLRLEGLLAIAVFYSAFSVGFFVRERMAALTGTSCGHGMEKTCAGLLMASTQWPSASRKPPAGTV